MKQSERALQFKIHYIGHFEDGLTVKEISDLYGLSQAYAYTLIRQIADENDVPYESLIRRPHAEHVFAGRRELRSAKPIDPTLFQNEFRATISSIDKSVNFLNKMLEEWKDDVELRTLEEVCE